MPSRGQLVDQRVVVAMRQVVMVLHADDRRRSGAFRDLRGGDVAQADVAHQALALQLGQHGERRLDRALGGAMDVEHDAQVDDVEHVEAEVAQVVVHRLRQFFAARRPGSTSRPRRAGRRPW